MSEPQEPQIASDLRAQISHLMIDLGVKRHHGQKHVEKLAAVLSERLGKRISRDVLSMALCGYRSTPVYIGYLALLKDHLEECIRDGKDPVAVYTRGDNCQGKTHQQRMGA